MTTETVDKVETEASNSEDSLDFEAKASELGWVPLEKFRGDPKKHVDAKTYYEKGELVLPIVKQQRDEAKKEAQAVRNELAEVKAAMSEFQKLTEAAAAREVKEQIAALKAEKAAAVAAGDDKAYQRADNAIDELKESQAKPKVEEKPKNGIDPDFASWLSENDWYTKDNDKRLEADVIGFRLTQKDPSLKGKAFFSAVTAELKAQESRNSGVERPGPQRGGGTTGNNPKAKTFDNLPAETKKDFDKLVKAGIKMTKEQYVSKCGPDAWEA